MPRISTLTEFERVAAEATRHYWNGGVKVRVGMASCGLAAGAGKLYAAAAERAGVEGASFTLSRVGCRGYCCGEPMVEAICPDYHLIFGGVTLKRMVQILEGVEKGEFSCVEKKAILGQEGKSPRVDGTPYIVRPGYPGEVPEFASIPFYQQQTKIITRNCGTIDPFNIEEALAREGYAALVRVLKDNDPEQVIQAVLSSGLRGRGGAGFPTGRKWALTREAPGDRKYVIVNADEGDPGAFMDRSILESDPHAVIEGLTIGGFAIGASEGIVYVRAEYPLAVETIERAIQQAREYGLLGEGILGTPFNFDISIKIGAGAFVCGEETALIASTEGRVGEPRPRPPFPARQGYRGMPTNINNVKTWAAVPPILNYGSEWFAGMGTEKSKGTAVFCITGDIKRTGLVEVPLGTPLERIVFGMGGGPEKKGREIKAAQTGGPSGGCLPSSRFDLPVDYEHLVEAGSMMGSGGMIVVDNRTCMVGLARYFLDFTMEESCGKCTPCREGTRRMHLLLEKMMAGEGTEEDIQLLQDLATYVKETSLCGLGATAPNPVLSTLRYFRDEYEAHVKEKKCPAGSCTALIRFSVDTEKCIACGACAKACPVDAITGEEKKPLTIDQALCTRCRSCFEICPADAVRIE